MGAQAPVCDQAHADNRLRYLVRSVSGSVNPPAAVNRESQRDFDVLSGVPSEKRAILDVDLAGRDERFGAAVNKKPHKTRDLTQKSRDSRLGFLCLPDWLSFEPILKGSPCATLFVTILSALEIRKALQRKDLRSSRPVRLCCG